MRIVATSDTHFPVDPAKIPDGDVFIHAGDLMYSGQVGEWRSRVDWLAQLPHKTKLLVPGNHDYHLLHYEGVARAELRRQAKVRVLMLHDGEYILPNGMSVLGLQFVTGLKGWAWNVEDDYLRDALRRHGEMPQIVVSHAPMWQRLDAIRPDAEDYNRQPVGTWAYADWFTASQVKPMHWICGHIHESYGTDELYGCKFYNVAMCDRNYDQTNPPMVIDV